MADPGTPDWWLSRLYRQLVLRRPVIDEWDRWYSGEHPAPHGYEKAADLLRRILDTVGLNILAVVTDAAHERMAVEGFKVGGQINDDVWRIWQDNNFDVYSSQIFLERMALSESYALVDPNNGHPILTPEHPLQCIVESYPGTNERAAGLKVWQDDLGAKPLIRAMLYLPDAVFSYAAVTRAFTPTVSSTTGRVNTPNYTISPSWELQESESGRNPFGEVPLVPFPNRPRMMRASVPEFFPAIRTQKRINKTLLDRMAMQDQGAFKALWATGLAIPTDPVTGEPVEDFVKAIDRIFVNENAAGKFGQFEAEDIKQMLEAANEDVKHAAVLVPTPPDQLLGEMVNVSADGLKSAQASLISRIRRHMRDSEDPLETVARLSLKGAGKEVPNVSAMTTVWRNPEFRTEGEMADAGVKALSAGVPHEAVWEKYFGAGPQDVSRWSQQLAETLASAAAPPANSDTPA